MPITYKKIGKTVKDLLSKTFDYDYTLDTKNKSKDGITMSSGFAMEGSNVLSGTAKMEYVDPAFGDVEVNMKVNGKKEDENTSLTAKFKKLSPGLEVSLSCNVIPEVSLTADYTKDAVAVQAALKSDMKLEKSKLSANGTFTQKNFGIGLSGVVDLKKQQSGDYQPSYDYNLGLQYTTKPHTVSLVTAKQCRTATLGYHVAVQDDLDVGVQAWTKNIPDFSEYGGTIGLNYKVNPTTSLKAKVDTSQTLSYSITHKLSNPPLKVNFAHALKPFGGDFTATNWGFGLTLGDY